METEVEGIYRAHALITFNHDLFQGTKHLFSEKNGIWFSFDPSPNIYNILSQMQAGRAESLGIF